MVTFCLTNLLDSFYIDIARPFLLALTREGCHLVIIEHMTVRPTAWVTKYKTLGEVLKCLKEKKLMLLTMKDKYI